MVKCNNCGAIIENSEVDIIQDLVGEYHGQPAYQAVEICPCCHSDNLTEVERLSDKDIMYNYICDDFLYQDIVAVMAEMLGDNEDVYKELYARLCPKHPDIEKDKDYIEYTNTHCWYERE